MAPILFLLAQLAFAEPAIQADLPGRLAEYQSKMLHRTEPNASGVFEVFEGTRRPIDATRLAVLGVDYLGRTRTRAVRNSWVILGSGLALGGIGLVAGGLAVGPVERVEGVSPESRPRRIAEVGLGAALLVASPMVLFNMPIGPRKINKYYSTVKADELIAKRNGELRKELDLSAADVRPLYDQLQTKTSSR